MPSSTARFAAAKSRDERPACRRSLWAAVAAVLALGAGPADENTFDETVRPLLERHCLECHAGDDPRTDLRLDRLQTDFGDPDSRKTWRAVLRRVEAGEMPPESQARPTDDEIAALAGWVRGQAAAVVAAEGRTVLRRLNRVEYENTVRDLLGIHLELQDYLPPDSMAHGFDNVGEAQHVSSFLMDRYLEAADRALAAAIANGPQPAPVDLHFSLKDEILVQRSSEDVFLHLDDALVMFSSSAWNSIVANAFYPPDGGLYRVRIRTSAYQSDGKPVTVRIEAGPNLMGQKNHLVGYFDVPAGDPTMIEFVDYFDSRHSVRLLPYGLAPAQVVTQVGAGKYEGPGLAVHWIEIQGPLYDAWPPASHRALLGDLPQVPAPNYRVEVASDDPLADAERILRRFAARAYRRAVTNDDIRPLVSLVEHKLAEGRSFEQAVRVGLLAVLVSPDFLFLREEPGPLDDFALASRLSYFLWSTMPDQELLDLAEQRTLTDPEVLRGQVERMLGDPRAENLTRNFVGQWLNLRDIDFTEPSYIYPEFDDLLKHSMVREAELFFAEVLRDDLSLTNFVASDFTVLNERLARHYGIPDIEGQAFRTCPLPAESHRGGVLTMAGVLKVTANGTYTSPVLRGAWVLDRILGTPPTQPPQGVPALEPDIRGATTIREQLARHRENSTCASCHTHIDPPGFALESFDVIGGWRDFYRTTGQGEAVEIDGRSMPYLRGPAVEPADTLADGRAFADIDELKQLLLADQDQIARALATRLLTYATGRAPDAVDAPQVDAIVARAARHDYGLRTLVHEIVQSELFRNK
jgi:mono/diheme cytochrome c family protein